MRFELPRKILETGRLRFEREAETRFRDDYFEKSLRIVRAALLLAFFLYASFGILDNWIVPDSKHQIWWIRYAVVCPFLVGVFAFTFLPIFRVAMQPALALAALVLGGGIVAMIGFARPGELGHDFYYAGLMLVLMWTYTVSRIRFYLATAVSWTITASYELVAVGPQEMLESVRSVTVFINNNFFFLSSNLIGMFAAFTIEYYIRKDFRQRQRIEIERARSERLLLNILPVSVAETLKKREGTIADGYENVTVLFADIVGFTGMAASSKPASIVNMLNQIFSTLDLLAEKHGLEKIKTIGDAYMVVGGLPEPSETHAVDVAGFALEAQREIRRFKIETTGERIHLRIGVNSGPAVAGVIGIKKFAYDLWGDTVNLASRMESHGVVDEVQVSQSTWKLIRKEFECESRGSIEVKGIGQMAAYLLKGRSGEAAPDPMPDKILDVSEGPRLGIDS